MERKFISCCYFPTTVVFVDDDERFLQSISLKLGRNLAYKLYQSPHKALQFLKDDYTADPFTNRCLLHPEERHRDHRNIDVDVRAIHQEIYNPERFAEISIIVVDYAMPGLNGLELCRQLASKNFKIILLTGEADEKIAIDAFNKRIIHHFIRKDSANFFDGLKQAIHELQQAYFQGLSEIIINGLTKNPEYESCCLDDPAFIKLFDEVYTQNNFTEYYLMDAAGSFLFLDFNGTPSWLAVKDESLMTGAAFDAEMSDQDVPAPVLEALRKREKLPYLHTDEDLAKDPADWLPYLHPANKLEGRIIYYYTYITDHTRYDIHSKRILSYKDYLDAH